MVNVVRLIPPKPPGPPVTLINDCCLNAMQSIESSSVDLVLCDPPYGTTACKWDSVIPLQPMWQQLLRIAKHNAAVVLFGAEPFCSLLRTSNIGMFKYDWVWVKSRPTGFLNAAKQPLRNTENISVFYRQQATYNRQFKEVKERVFTRTKGGGTYGEQNDIPTGVSNGGQENPYTTLYFNCVNGSHPTQKPVSLMEYLIKTYSNEGDTVLDFAMGSGTTGVACKNLNRKFIGIEKDLEYFRIASERIDKA